MGQATFHYGIGNAGYAFAILSFVFGIAGTLSYLLSLSPGQADLATLGKRLGAAQALSVFAVVACLFVIIKNHYFEYGYAWSHSSLHLDPKYMIACFWEGQEGSFLLWAFWNAVIWLGLTLAGVQLPPIAGAVLLSVQAVLASMILGLDFAGLKVGSSPFILLRDQMAGQAPIFALNPEYIPKDGRGLNPLLQNYWNIIHPPTLFLGFALTGVPYALSVAGLVGKEGPSKLLRNWLIVAAAVLGIGIMMGAYWAYETLNFGGYWNWDPVENAVYIPWLVLVAALHTLLLPKAKAGNQKLAHALVQCAFILILYSTFLTRSGVLGDTSVHSFTDLGLSGQLLVFLGCYLALSGWLLFSNKSADNGSKTSTVEWLLLGGITLLMLASFQVLVSTSIPVFNELGKLVGIDNKLAPPANPIQHYTNWQMAFAIGILALSAVAQVMYRLSGRAIKLAVWQYLAMAVVFAGGYVAIAYGLKRWQDYALFLLALGAIASNGYLITSRFADGIRRNAGTVAHLGMAVMLMGVLFSAGYDKVVSVNRSGRVYSKEFSTEMTRDNVLLWRGKPMQMDGYDLLYKGPKTELAEPYALVDADSLMRIGEGGFRAVALGSLLYNGKAYGKRGDTVAIRPENTYYQVLFRDTASKEEFILYPRAQANPNMGLLASPDVRMRAGFDLYTHVSSIPNGEDKDEHSELQRAQATIGKVFFANDYVCKFREVRPITTLMELPGVTFDAGVEAVIEVQGPTKSYQARPKYMIRGNEAGRVFSDIKELGIRFEIMSIDPATGIFEIGYHTTQQDWIILKAVKKPFIALVWGGFLIMTAGFFMALTQRKRSDKATKPAKAPAAVLSK